MLKLNRRAMIALAAAATAAMTPALAQDAGIATRSSEGPGDFSIGAPDAPMALIECPSCVGPTAPLMCVPNRHNDDVASMRCAASNTSKLTILYLLRVACQSSWTSL